MSNSSILYQVLSQNADLLIFLAMAGAVALVASFVDWLSVRRWRREKGKQLEDSHTGSDLKDFVYSYWDEAAKIRPMEIIVFVVFLALAVASVYFITTKGAEFSYLLMLAVSVIFCISRSIGFYCRRKRGKGKKP
jgi:hypothetical protein